MYVTFRSHDFLFLLLFLSFNKLLQKFFKNKELLIKIELPVKFIWHLLDSITFHFEKCERFVKKNFFEKKKKEMTGLHLKFTNV